MSKTNTSTKSIMSMSLAGPIPPAPPGHTWHTLMGLALDEAHKAQTQHHPAEVPVGAVLVDIQGTILATSHNETITLSDPTAHAEVLALRRAGQKLGNYRLEQCILIVTLEPCLMCAGALVHSRIAGLVYGAADLKAGCISSCMESLNGSFLNHNVWHMGGIRSDECAKVLTDFFAQKK